MFSHIFEAANKDPRRGRLEIRALGETMSVSFVTYRPPTMPRCRRSCLYRHWPYLFQPVSHVSQTRLSVGASSRAIPHRCNLMTAELSQTMHLESCHGRKDGLSSASKGLEGEKNAEFSSGSHFLRRCHHLHISVHHIVSFRAL